MCGSNRRAAGVWKSKGGRGAEWRPRVRPTPDYECVSQERFVASKRRGSMNPTIRSLGRWFSPKTKSSRSRNVYMYRRGGKYSATGEKQMRAVYLADPGTSARPRLPAPHSETLSTWLVSKQVAASCSLSIYLAERALGAPRGHNV